MANDVADPPNLTSAAEGAPASGDPLGNTTCMCEAPPKKKIPIIFVPGVMGSRLHVPAINESWDPDSNWAMVHWLRIGMERARTELHRNSAVQIMGAQKGLSDDEVAHGYGGVCMEFYVPFLRFLRDAPPSPFVNTPVWAVGYDWRQSNQDSATYVTGEVNTIMKHEGVGQVILVSHSMGGIVTRAAMQAGLAGSVLGVIHIFQPVDGAVVMYRRFFTGATTALDPTGDGHAGGLNRIIGNTGLKFATISSGMPGPIQLLPTNNYRDTGGKDWINYKVEGVTASWTGDVYELYNGTLSPPAIAHPDMIAVARTDLRANLTAAQAFHATLGRYQHPNTRTIHSTAGMTDMCVLFDPPTQPAPVTTTVPGWFGTTRQETTIPPWMNRGAQRQAREEGDTTVPATSANPLKPNVEVRGVEHGAACNDGPTEDQALAWIREFIA